MDAGVGGAGIRLVLADDGVTVAAGRLAPDFVALARVFGGFGPARRDLVADVLDVLVFLAAAGGAALAVDFVAGLALAFDLDADAEDARAFAAGFFAVLVLPERDVVLMPGLLSVRFLRP